MKSLNREEKTAYPFSLMEYYDKLKYTTHRSGPPLPYKIHPEKGIFAYLEKNMDNIKRNAKRRLFLMKLGNRLKGKIDYVVKKAIEKIAP